MTIASPSYHPTSRLAVSVNIAWCASAITACGRLLLPDSALLEYSGYLHVGAVLVTVLWTRRAYQNLSAIGHDDLRFSPVWAAASFFVPIANLFVPYQVLSDIYRQTTRDKRPAPKLLLFWWLAFLLAYLTSLDRNTDPHSLMVQSAALSVVAATIWSITGRIERQFTEYRTRPDTPPN